MKFDRLCQTWLLSCLEKLQLLRGYIVSKSNLDNQWLVHASVDPEPRILTDLSAVQWDQLPQVLIMEWELETFTLDMESRLLRVILSNHLKHPRSHLEETLTCLYESWSQQQIMETILTGQFRMSEMARTQELFLATMSHEIRTPLAGLLGMAKLLQTSQPALPAKQMDYVQTIYNCGYNLLELLNDVLDFCKMDAGKLVLSLLPMDLSLCIQQAKEVAMIRAQEKKLTLSVKIQKSVPAMILGDFRRLKQVLVNLLINAIKFTTQGSVTVSVQTVTGSDHSDWLDLQVSDTGIGMTPETVARMFEPFWQKDRTGSEGTGLGLAICQRLIMQMQGTIACKQSVPGSGTVMQILLPLREPSADPLVTGELIQWCQSKTIWIQEPVEKKRMQWWQWCSKCKLTPTVLASVEEMAFMVHSEHLPIPDILVLSADAYTIIQSAPRLRNGTFLIWNGNQTLKPVTALLPSHKLVSCVAESETAFYSALLQLQQKPSTVVLFPLNPLLLPPSTTPSNLFKPTFSVFRRTRLPVYSAQSVAEKPTGAWEKHCKILIVEDHATNAQVCVEFLRQNGFPAQNLALAKDGLEAVRMCEGQSFDIILMDLKMPRLNGIDATRRILAHCHAKSLPKPVVLAMTACGMGTESEQCQQVGMAGFISKPLVLDELKNVLFRALFPR